MTAGAKLTADHLAAYAAFLKRSVVVLPAEEPLLSTMTGAFLVGIIVSLLAPERSAQEGFSEVERRAVLGEPRGVSRRVNGGAICPFLTGRDTVGGPEEESPARFHSCRRNVAVIR